MMIVIPTWEVTVNHEHRGPIVYRVPQSSMDEFLKVLTFNDLEFSTRKERRDV